MPIELIVILLIAAPMIAGLWLRVNSLYVGLGIAVGYMLSSQLTPWATDLLGQFMNSQQDLVVVSRLGLMLLPVILVLFIGRKTLTKNKLAVHFVPMVFASLAFFVVALPLTSSSVQKSWSKHEWSKYAQSGETIVLLGFALTQFAVITLTKPRHHDEKLGKHKK